MRIPVPRRKLVMMTVLGAVLTGAVALGLAAPSVGDVVGSTDAGGQVNDAAPAPNPSVSPGVGADEPAEDARDEVDEYDDVESE